MKRLLTSALWLCLLIAGCAAIAGCKDKNKKEDPLPTVTPLEAVAVPSPVLEASAEVGQSLSYYFKNIGGVSMIYGAAEVKNTSSAPMIITNASFAFKVKGKAVQKDIVPVFNDSDIIAPGETAHICVWSNYDAKTEDEVDTEVAVTVDVEAAGGSRGLELSNLRIIHNYPGFPTLSGHILSRSDVSYKYTINYSAFYDSQDKLLGVWYFTKDAALESGAHRDFVAHMQSLPIPDLAENTVKILGRSIGVS